MRYSAFECQDGTDTLKKKKTKNLRPKINRALKVDPHKYMACMFDMFALF